MLHAMRCVVLIIALSACADHAQHSVALYDNGDYSGAAHAADEGLATHPDDAGLWGMRIRAALAEGDAATVVKAYSAYRDKRGDDDKELLRDLATATLDQALASPSVQLKIAAIQAVQEIEIESLALTVAKRMEDDDDRVAATAAIAVLRAFPQAPKVASQMLESENPEARRIAVDGIGKKVGKLAAGDLEKAANDADPRVRAAAVHWLGQIKDRDAGDVLAKRQTDPDEAVRAAAATAIAQIGTGDLDAAAKTALGDKARAVRTSGVAILIAAHRDAELVALAGDPDPVVALDAAIAAKRTRPELAAQAIERAIGDDDWAVRAGAANQLMRAVGKVAALPLAKRLIGDKDRRVRAAAARLLAHAGDAPDAIAVFAAIGATDLQGEEHSPDDPHASDVIEAWADLGSLDDARGLKGLSELVANGSAPQGQRVAAANAHRTARHVTAGLVAALADQSGTVRVAAATAIGVLAKH